MRQLAEKLANRLAAGDLSEEEMNAIMADHDREVSQLSNVLADEKEKQMADLREKLRRRREEKEAALLRKQQEEVRDNDLTCANENTTTMGRTSLDNIKFCSSRTQQQVSGTWRQFCLLVFAGGCTGCDVIDVK